MLSAAIISGASERHDSRPGPPSLDERVAVGRQGGQGARLDHWHSEQHDGVRIWGSLGGRDRLQSRIHEQWIGPDGMGDPEVCAHPFGNTDRRWGVREGGQDDVDRTPIVQVLGRGVCEWHPAFDQAGGNWAAQPVPHAAGQELGAEPLPCVGGVRGREEDTLAVRGHGHEAGGGTEGISGAHG